MRVLLRNGGPDSAIADAVRASCQRQVDRAPDQHGEVCSSAAADVFDRRVARYFFSAVCQFSRMVTGEAAVSSSGVFIKKRLPSGESQRQE